MSEPISNSQFLSPEELVNKYPQVAAKFHWNSRELGLFLKCKLLNGYYDRTKRVALIREASFLQLIEFTNNIIDEQKVKF